MPRLPQYTANIGGARQSASIEGRRATAADTGGLQAVALQELGQQGIRSADEILTNMEREDARRALVDNHKLRTKYAAELHNAELTGEPLDKVRERFETDSAALMENYQTRVGRDAHDRFQAESIGLLEHGIRQVETKRSSAQMQKDVNDYLANAAVQMQTDPTSVDFQRQGMHALLDTFAGKLTPEMIAKAKQESDKRLTVSGVNAAIEADPETSLKLLQGNHQPWGMLPPEQRAALVNTAQAEIRRRQSDERSARLNDRADRLERAQKAADGFVEKILSDTPKDQRAAISKMIMQDPDLTPQQKEHYVTLNERRAQERVERTVDDPVVVRDLFSRIRSAYDDLGRIKDVREIEQAYVEGKIKRETLVWLRGEFAADRDPAGASFLKARSEHLQIIRRIVDKSTLGSTDPAGAARFNEYAQALSKEIQRYRDEGLNPWKLLDPNSGEYFGKNPLAQSRGPLEVAKEKIEKTKERMRSKEAGRLHVPGIESPKAPMDVTGMTDAQMREAGVKPGDIVIKNGKWFRVGGE